MLTYWGTCIGVTEDTDIDLPLLVQLDENGVRVSAEFFASITYVPEFLEKQLLNKKNILLVYPNKKKPKVAAIYSYNKDIHYLFQ